MRGMWRPHDTSLRAARRATRSVPRVFLSSSDACASRIIIFDRITLCLDLGRRTEIELSSKYTSDLELQCLNTMRGLLGMLARAN